jgi:hypothetical protein
MMLRNTNNGSFQIYDIKDNQVILTISMGRVGLDWQVAGFNNHGTETDMVLRNSGTGALALYDISNSRLTGVFSLGGCRAGLAGRWLRQFQQRAR